MSNDNNHHPRPLAFAAAGLFMCLLALASPGTARAQPVTLNLKGADIQALISTVAEATGRNFVVDPRVKGQVTVISAREMEREELYEVFLSILEVHGFAAVPAGNVTKIVPNVKAKQDGIPNIAGDAPDTDQMVTQVIQVNNVTAAQLVPILRPLVPQQAHLAAYPPTNVLVISDRAANVRRIVEIIERIDRVSDSAIDIVPLEHASASEIVRVLQALQQKSGAKQPAQQAVQLAADDRTNSVLLGGERSERLRLRALIAHLDTPLDAGGNTRVVYLRYAKAEDLVPVLTGVSESIQTGKNKGGKTAARPGAQVNIQADPAANALVITAPPDVFRSLQSVIKRLDIRRAQVLVEAVIAEVSFDKTRELGVQWLMDGTPDGSGPAGMINFGDSTSLGSIAAAADQGAIPPVNGALLGFGLVDSETFNFGVLINALSNDANTNILSTPTLVTMDNQEAEVVVGQNVPFVTGSFTNTGGTGGSVNPFQTIERQDVGLTLKVTPQINEGNAVQLEISQEISSLSSSSANAADLITNTRKINTTVMVEDRQVVVLYGLIDDSILETEQKVPVLGDVPVLGHLFRYNKVNKVKRNLMVFLRPVIIRDGLTQADIVSGKYQYLRAQQLEVRRKGIRLMPEEASPVLPEDMDRMADPAARSEGLPPAPQPEARGSAPVHTARAAAEDWFAEDEDD